MYVYNLYEISVLLFRGRENPVYFEASFCSLSTNFKQAHLRSYPEV